MWVFFCIINIDTNIIFVVYCANDLNRKSMKKCIPFLLLLSFYFLFCNMSCNEYDPYQRINQLVSIKLANMDFSGTEMKLVSEKTPKQAFVVGVQCFGDVYEQYIPEYGGTPGEKLLLEENVVVNDSRFENVDGDFQIITVNDFDEKHLAGSDVTDCFVMTGVRRGEQVKDFSYSLILRKMPQSGIHSFKLMYKLKEEKEDEQEATFIEAITEPIELY